MRLQTITQVLFFVAIFLFQTFSQAAPVTIFGPKKYQASLSGKETQTSVTGPAANRDGVITIINGDGQDLKPVTCSGNLVQRLLCELGNLERKIVAELQRPERPEIYWNGVQIVSKSNLPQTTGKLQIAVKVQLQNSLKVNLKGLPTSYLSVEIKSESQTPNQIPVARISATPTGGIAPELISFSGITSSDPDGDVITNYEWDFGDGGFATGMVVTHNFAMPATYNVKLTVTDSKGGKGTATLPVVIKANQLPLANFVTTTDTALGVLKAHFDASTSSDSDGSIVDYQWSFGDGSTGSGKVVDHVYQTSGIYSVSLVVKDNKQGLGEKSASVVMKDQTGPVLSNIMPSMDSSIAGLRILVSGESNERLASASVNGVLLDISSDQLSFSGQYLASNEGTHILLIQVSDMAGNVTKVNLSVTIQIPNQPPIAALKVSREVGNIPFSVQFDASTSSDPDNNIQSYFWDFGDGEFQTTSTPKVDHLYAKSGNALAIVTVFDVKGLSSSASVNIFGNTPPVAKLKSEYSIGIAPFIAAFNASESSDLEQNLVQEYEWNFGDGQTATSSSSMIQHTYSSAGNYTISVTVRDTLGLSASTSTDIQILSESDGGSSEQGEVPSLGTIELSGIDSHSFNSVDAVPVFMISGAQFSGNKSSIQISVNGYNLPEDQFVLYADRIVTKGFVQNGLNEISLRANDQLGRIINYEARFYAGEDVLQVHVVNEDGSDDSNIYAFAEIPGLEQQIGEDASSTGSAVSIPNIPENEDVLLYVYDRSRTNAVRVPKGTRSIEVMMRSQIAPSLVDNNDFSKGADGWTVSGGISTVQSNGAESFLRVFGVSGSTTSIKRTFTAKEFNYYTASFQVTLSKEDDAFTAILKSEVSGMIKVYSKSGRDLTNLKDVPVELTVENAYPNEALTLEVIIHSPPRLEANIKFPMLNIFIPSPAYAEGQNPQVDIFPIKGSNIYISQAKFYDFSTSPNIQDANARCTSDDLVANGLISVGPIPSTYFEGKNKICANIEVKKNSNQHIQIRSAYLELVSNSSIDQEVSVGECALGVTATPMDSAALYNLNNALNLTAVVATQTGNQQIFSFSNLGDLVADEKIYLRIKMNTSEWSAETGVEEKRCIGYRVKSAVRPLFSMPQRFLASGAKRYGVDRDDDRTDYVPKREIYGHQGGDDWVSGHVAVALNRMLNSSNRGLVYNDISNMNGNTFKPHLGHKSGTNVDLQSYSTTKNAMINGFATAGSAYDILQTLAISEIKGSAQVKKVLINFKKSEQDPFWNQVAPICLEDGRSARSIIKQDSGHRDHFHMEYNVTPNRYVDYRSSTPKQPDFVFSANGTDQYSFLALQSDATDYVWVFQDLTVSKTFFIDKDIAARTSMNIANPTVTLIPGHRYDVTIVGMKVVESGSSSGDKFKAETCISKKKGIVAYTTSQCNGNYGDSFRYKNENEPRGFVAATVKMFPDLDNQSPAVGGVTAQVCDNTILTGPVSVGSGAILKGKNDIRGTVSIVGAIIDGLTANAEYRAADFACCYKSISIGDNAEFIGDIHLTVTEKRGILGFFKGRDDRGPRIRGSGVITDAYIYGAWDIDVEYLNIVWSWLLDRDPSVPQQSKTISGSEITMNNVSFSQIIPVNISGKVKIEATGFTGPVEITGESNLFNVGTEKAGLSVHSTSITNTSFRDPGAPWVVNAPLNDVRCSRFVQGKNLDGTLANYYVENLATGGRSCRAEYPKGSGRFDMIDQWGGVIP